MALTPKQLEDARKRVLEITARLVAVADELESIKEQVALSFEEAQEEDSDE